jgi:hypothetical protein
MDIQARIPPALAATYNFILTHDSQEQLDMARHSDPHPGNIPAEHEFGTLTHRPANAAERARAKTKRDQIAQEMWDSYQQLLAERGGNYGLEE